MTRFPFDHNGYFTFTVNTITGRWNVTRSADNWSVAENVDGFSEAVRLAAEYFKSLPF